MPVKENCVSGHTRSWWPGAIRVMEHALRMQHLQIEGFNRFEVGHLCTSQRKSTRDALQMVKFKFVLAVQNKILEEANWIIFI